MIHDTKKQNPFASPGGILKKNEVQYIYIYIYIAVGFFRSDAGIWNHPVERKKTYSEFPTLLGKKQFI